MWIEFVVGSCPCFKRFSLGAPVFLPWQSTNIINSKLTWQKWTGRATPWLSNAKMQLFIFLCTTIHAGFATFGTSHYIYCLGRGWKDFHCITLKLILYPPLPPKLCSILMIPLIGSQCLIAPPPLWALLAMTVFPSSWKPCDSPSFLPPPPVINDDRCFIFNFPLAERGNFTSSAQRTCLQHLVSRKLSLFFHFSGCFCFCLFVFFCFFVFFLQCSLDPISSKWLYVFIESPVKKMTKPSKPWQKLIRLRIVLNRRKL